MSTIIKKPSQSYSVFVYNGAGTQGGNRFNNFADLMTATGKQNGYKLVYIERDETLPAGDYNFDYVEFRGNGQAYDSGGFTVTFPTGVTISSWTFGVIDSLRFYSTSTSPIWTTAAGFLLQINTQAELWSTTAEFIKNTGGGQCIFSCGRAGRIKDGGYEVFNTTAGAYSTILILTRADNATIANETMRSTNAVVFLDLVQATISDLHTSGFPSTHSNLTIGVDFSAIQPDRSAMTSSLKVLADGTSITPITGSSVNKQDNTQAAGNLTINAPTGYKGTAGTELELLIKATNTQTYVFNAVYRGSTSLALPASCIGGKQDRIKFIWHSGDSKWDLVRYVGGF